MIFTRDRLKASGVVTIGGFDGIHLGHQQLLQRVTERARQFGLPATVITFEPPPKEYFVHNLIRITTWNEKLLWLQSLGIDQILCLRFNQRLASLTADEFIGNILIKKLNVHYLVVGEDFRFGLRQSGDIKLLQQYKACNFKLEVVPDFFIDGELVKSTAIRQALISSDLAKVERFLGRPYSITGRVAHGDHRGRLLGFPTANVYLTAKIAPLRGVYATRVYLDQEIFRGCANIGFRPTIGDGKHVLEVNLLDFDRDIYGKRIKVEFIYKLRDEKKFANLDQLKQQIAEDVGRLETSL